MDDKELAKRLLQIASAIVEEENVTAAAKQSEAAADAAVPAEEPEDPAFKAKVKGIYPMLLKKLNGVRGRKIKTLSDKVSASMTVEDLIDVLLDIIAKVA